MRASRLIAGLFAAVMASAGMALSQGAARAGLPMPAGTPHFLALVQVAPSMSPTAAPSLTPAPAATSVASPTEPPAATQVPPTTEAPPTSVPPPTALSANLSIVALSGPANPEYVTITNIGGNSQDMTDWYLVSVVDPQTYYFPRGYALAAGASVEVESNSNAISSPPTILFWTTSPIWIKYWDSD
jgi:hypothetical protein